MWIGLASIASGAPAVPPPDAYVDAVSLIERLYLEPQALDASDMLQHAATQLADDVHWLQVRFDGPEVSLVHGAGAPIGSVAATGLRDLPAALARAESLVVGAGYDLDGVDVRLSLLSGMVEALDRHSRVLADERLDRFQSRLSGTAVGVGATFEVRGDRVVVAAVTEGGPGALSGLAVGDVVLRIDGRSTVGMPLSEVAGRVRGDDGTPVVLSVQRGAAELAIRVLRAEVVLPNVTWDVLPEQVGYVRIDHVSQRTVENLRAALAALQSRGALSQGLVIDLRGNTGGSMKESANVADLFLTSGLLLRTVGKDGGEVQNLQAEMVARADGTEPDVPIVLVVDERTASGAEILAGALVELGRAATIGTRTYGKGTVQKTYALGPDVRLKLTVARYILANGRRIGEDGIAPDVWVGQVAVSRDAVRFRGWDDGAEVVPEVTVGTATPNLAVEIARRAVASAAGSDRAAVLAALTAAAAAARPEQTARLASILQPRGLDWSPQVVAAGPIAADVRVAAAAASEGSWSVTASVQNRGSTALHRAFVELSCPSAPYWDGVVVPIGALAAGATGRRTATVRVPPGVAPREDVVQVRLLAEGREALDAGSAVLASGSAPLPEIEVHARLEATEEVGPHGYPVVRADVDLINRSKAALGGVVAHFGFPQEDGIELLGGGERPVTLGPGSGDRVGLTLELAPGAERPLPLELVVESEEYGLLADWPVRLPADGEKVMLRAPRIEPRPPSRSGPVGRYALPVTVTDERRVDHVTVVVNGHKVAWAAGAGPAVELVARFALEPGANEVSIVAEDDQGVVATGALSIRGEPAADAVDAD